MMSTENRARRGPELGGVMSFEQIADELHTSVQSVHASYTRGIKKLRAHPDMLTLLVLARRLVEERHRREDGRSGG